MKRLLFFSILVTLLCGCNPAGNKGQDSVTDSIGVVSDDTIALEVPEDPVPEPEPEPPFTSPDLKFHRVQGHVKQIVEKWKNGGASGSETYNFDRQGRWTPNKQTKIKRNSKGQIVNLETPYDDYRTDSYEYRYNQDGYVYYEDFCWDIDPQITKYTLNENGWPVSAKVEYRDCSDESLNGSGTEHYTYSEIDEHGNWTKCQMKAKGSWIEEKYAYTLITTRKITYWQ